MLKHRSFILTTRKCPPFCIALWVILEEYMVWEADVPRVRAIMYFQEGSSHGRMSPTWCNPPGSPVGNHNWCRGQGMKGVREAVFLAPLIPIWWSTTSWQPSPCYQLLGSPKVVVVAQGVLHELKHVISRKNIKETMHLFTFISLYACSELWLLNLLIAPMAIKSS